MDSQVFTMLGISLVICRNKKGQYLTVRECEEKGWWLPGGLVDPPENFSQAALRETIEEAGIHVELKGILRTEYKIQKNDFQQKNHFQRLKVVFYAEPIDENEIPKSFADSESEEARWVSLDDLNKLKDGTPGWRGPELFEWATYIENQGSIFPLSSFDYEGSQISYGKSFSILDLPLNK